jgi:uncharacterized membrane protein
MAGFLYGAARAAIAMEFDYLLKKLHNRFGSLR